MRHMPLLLLALVACKQRHEPQMREQPGSGSGSAAVAVKTKTYDAIGRSDFNRFAVRLNLPVYWIADANNDKRIDPDEVVALLFYPTIGKWTSAGAFTPAFESAYDRIVANSQSAPSA